MESQQLIKELETHPNVGFVSLRDERDLGLTVTVEALEFAYEFFWPRYVSYAVRSEHYCQFDATEVWVGDIFRTYSTSRFLAFVDQGTFADQEFLPGPFKHYQIQSLYQIIDIASPIGPTVRRVACT